jgi:hypothetical protein
MAAEQRHTSNAMASFRVDQLQTKLPQPHTACCSLRTRGNKGRRRGQTARGARAGTVQREQRQRQQQRPYVRRSPRPGRYVFVTPVALASSSRCRDGRGAH